MINTPEARAVHWVDESLKDAEEYLYNNSTVFYFLVFFTVYHTIKAILGVSFVKEITLDSNKIQHERDP